MAEPPIADDYSSIAARLKELGGAKPVKWAVWYPPDNEWTYLHPGKEVRLARGRPVSLFDSEEDARIAIAAADTSVGVRNVLTPKLYEQQREIP